MATSADPWAAAYRSSAMTCAFVVVPWVELEDGL
jgi:hypothetical protein